MLATALGQVIPHPRPCEFTHTGESREAAYAIPRIEERLKEHLEIEIVF